MNDIIFKNDSSNPVNSSTTIYVDGEEATNIVIPDSATIIGDYSFRYWKSLSGVTILGNITKIGKSAFYLCKKLTDITLPETVTTIDDNAFCYCATLETLTIPSSVTTIGKQALQICYDPSYSKTSSATITFLGTIPPSIQSNTFYANKLNKIIVPAGCGEAYKSATNWSNFADYIEEATE